MDFALRYLSAFTKVFAIILLTSTINSTVIWLLWPIVVSSVAPQLVQLGYIPVDLPWTAAFGLCWLTGILFSRVIHISNKE